MNKNQCLYLVVHLMGYAICHACGKWARIWALIEQSRKTITPEYVVFVDRTENGGGGSKLILRTSLTKTCVCTLCFTSWAKSFIILVGSKRVFKLRQSNYEMTITPEYVVFVDRTENVEGESELTLRTT